eukprot:4619027-Amphidinium_carterae.1
MSPRRKGCCPLRKASAQIGPADIRRAAKHPGGSGVGTTTCDHGSGSVFRYSVGFFYATIIPFRTPVVSFPSKRGGFEMFMWATETEFELLQRPKAQKLIALFLKERGRHSIRACIWCLLHLNMHTRGLREAHLNTRPEF